MNRHNGNPNDEEVLVDKYATKAVSLDSTPPQFRTKSQAIDTAGLKGFTSKDQQKKEEEAVEKKPDGRFTRKMKRLFGTVGQMKTMFFQGFKMGAVVGGIFGGLTGLYYAFQTRSFMYIPMIMLTSGGSFGFFMGVGNIMRSEMESSTSANEEEGEYSIVTLAVKEDATLSMRREPIYYKQCMQQV